MLVVREPLLIAEDPAWTGCMHYIANLCSTGPRLTDQKRNHLLGEAGMQMCCPQAWFAPRAG